MFKKHKNKKALKKALRTEKSLQKALKKEAASLEKEKDTAFDMSVIEWEAPLFIKHQKGLVWYAVFATICIAAALGAVYYEAWSFAAVIGVFLFTYLLIDRTKPKNTKIILSEIGIKVGKKIYQYGRIQAFWLVYNPPFVKTLNIRVHNEYLVDITIQLGNQDPSVIHQFLSKKVPELEGKDEGTLNALSRIFKL
jgi:hypothetical protein